MFKLFIRREGETITMKKYIELSNGEKQKCVHCNENRERSYWFLDGKICDFCLDHNRPCGICNKYKQIKSQFEPKEIICKDCKETLINQ